MNEFYFVGGATSPKQRRPRVSASQGVEVEIIDVPFRATSAQDNVWIGPGCSQATADEVIIDHGLKLAIILIHLIWSYHHTCSNITFDCYYTLDLIRSTPSQSKYF